MEEGDASSACSFFAAAALQLCDTKTEARREIAHVLPVLRSLLAEASGGTRSATLASTASQDALLRLVSWFDADAQRRNTDTGSVRCGWLRKMSSSTLTTNKRWVVLDGTTLMYYKDQTETELRGVLQLKGARVQLYKRRLAFGWGGGNFAFEMTTAQQTLGAVVAEDAFASAVAPSPSTSASVARGVSADSAATSQARRHAATDATLGVSTALSDSSDALGVDADSGHTSFVDDARPKKTSPAAALSPAAGTPYANAGRDASGAARQPRGSFARLFAGKKRVALVDAPSAAELADATADGGTVTDDIVYTSSKALLNDVVQNTGNMTLPEVPIAINPLHKNKHTYVWLCDTAQERDAWIAALQRAIDEAASESAVLSWSRRFAHATNRFEYKAALAALYQNPQEVRVSADWARVHMAASKRREMHGGLPQEPELEQGFLSKLWLTSSSIVGVGGGAAGGSGSAASSARGAELLVSLPVEGSSSNGSGATNNGGSPGVSLIDASNPQNRRVARVLQRRNQLVRDMRKELQSGEASGRVAVAAEAAELLREDALAAVASAEVSARRRRTGYTPGDRVSLRQVGRDSQRDTIVINGVARVNASVVALITALARAVMDTANAAFSAWHARRYATEPAPELLMWFDRPVLDTEVAVTGGRIVERQVLEFAREVLVCTSRTVVGGDTLDALDLLFRNPACVVLIPDSHNPPEPVVIRATIREPTTTTSPPTSVPGSPVVSAAPRAVDMINPLVTAQQAQQAQQHTAAGALKRPNSWAATQPNRHSAMFSDDEDDSSEESASLRMRERERERVEGDAVLEVVAAEASAAGADEGDADAPLPTLQHGIGHRRSVTSPQPLLSRIMMVHQSSDSEDVAPGWRNVSPRVHQWEQEHAAELATHAGVAPGVAPGVAHHAPPQLHVPQAAADGCAAASSPPSPVAAAAPLAAVPPINLYSTTSEDTRAVGAGAAAAPSVQDERSSAVPPTTPTRRASTTRESKVVPSASPSARDVDSSEADGAWSALPLALDFPNAAAALAHIQVEVACTMRYRVVCVCDEGEEPTEEEEVLNAILTTHLPSDAGDVRRRRSSGVGDSARNVLDGAESARRKSSASSDVMSRGRRASDTSTRSAAVGIVPRPVHATELSMVVGRYQRHFAWQQQPASARVQLEVLPFAR